MYVFKFLNKNILYIYILYIKDIENGLRDPHIKMINISKREESLPIYISFHSSIFIQWERE